MNSKEFTKAFKGTNPKVFLAAAEFLDRHPVDKDETENGCCYALWRNSPASNGKKEERTFNRIFMPIYPISGRSAFYMAYPSGCYFDKMLSRRHMRERRILALLLCYEISKEVNKKRK